MYIHVFCIKFVMLDIHSGNFAEELLDFPTLSIINIIIIIIIITIIIIIEEKRK